MEADAYLFDGGTSLQRFKGAHVQKRYRYLRLVVVMVSLWAVAGSERAAALVFTGFGMPTSGATPVGITTGPDGALWFTETNVNKISRMTTARVVTIQITIPT